VLAGRQGDLRDLLGAASDAARRGRGGLALVGGEPGIGKTRLAGEVVDRLRADGFTSSWVSCPEDAGAPPYWAWTRLLGQLGAAGALTAPDGVSDPEVARFVLFEAVTTALRSAAARSPLLLVLDDVHWLDEPSLRLLEAVRPELASSPILVLGTYRDTEPGAARLATLGPGRRLLLGGLAAAELGAALSEVTGERLGGPLVAALHRRTGGNPYFAAEMVRLLRADGRLAAPAPVDGSLPLPDTVRAVLERRLARLPGPAHELLHVLALLGDPVRVPLAAALVGMPADRAAELAQAAVAARLLLTGDGDADGGHRFAHPLVRQTLVAQLGPVRRRTLHRRIGSALAARVDAGLAQPAEAARHLLSAVELGDGSAAEAVARAEQAAAWAMRHTAYEDAAVLLRSALAVAGEQPGLRAGLLCVLGDATLSCGDRAGAGEVYRDAAAQARRAHRPDLLAAAALGLAGGADGFEIDLLDPDRVAVLDEALAALPDGDSGTRATLLGRLSLALAFTGADPRRRELAERAVAMARRLDDPGVLAGALAAWCDVCSGPRHVPARRAASTEIVRLASGSGDRLRELLGRRLRVVALAEAGEWAAVDAEVEGYERLARRLGQGRLTWYGPLWRGARALMRGAEDEALGHAARLDELADTAGSPNVRLLGMVQRFVRLTNAGRADEVLAEILEFLALSPYESSTVTACTLAMCHAHSGRSAEARSYLDRVVTDPDGIPLDSEWLPELAQIADAACLAGHRPAAELAYRSLAPYAGLSAVEGILAGSWGSVAAHLGRLAHLLGRPEEARAHFAAALPRDTAAGAALAERTRGWAAEAGLGDGVVTGAAAARPYSVTGEPEPTGGTEPTGPTGPTGEPEPTDGTEPTGPTGPTGEPEPTDGTGPPGPTGPTGPTGGFHRDAGVWTLDYAGRTARLTDAKGLRDLALLLARPGEQTHVRELCGGVTEQRDTGPLADRRAVAAYRRRLDELAEERDRAQAEGDAGRAGRTAAEREALLAELSAVTGIGGRPRRGGSDTERMRKAVGNRVRQAVDRISEVHPELGRHLRASVRTGTWCGYQPEHPVRWRVRA
jgi:nucleoside-triphosphatase THEP1